MIEKGELDRYDQIFAKDRLCLYIVDKNLKILPVKNRLDVYENETEALTDINLNASAYAGQIIMIKGDDEKYRPYIVNCTDDTNKFRIDAVRTDNLNDPNILLGDISEYVKELVLDAIKAEMKSCLDSQETSDEDICQLFI